MKHEKTLRAPDWCHWGQGPSKVLVLAPHGGAKPHPKTARVPRRTDKPRKINDLHTAEVALSLAASLGASYVVNRGIDRNQLDLNRISQVRKNAPWYLELLGRLIHDIVERHGEAHVLVVHGWNVNQCRCDIGVGANLDDESIDLSRLTVSSEFTQHYLRPLVERAAPRHHITLGRRYPARHRNNTMQLFRRDGSRNQDLPADFAEIVGSGRCQAVQLELGIPMRWPGPLREDFLQHLVSVFRPPDANASPRSTRDTAHASRRAPNRPGASTPAGGAGASRYSSPPPHPESRTLQAFDPHSRVAILASLDPFPGTELCFGRVALFLPDGSVGLYTGEARNPEELAVDGPSFRGDEGALELEFDGSVLVTPDGADFVDLERALDRSVLSETRIDLRLTSSPLLSASGRVAGTVKIGGRSLAIDTHGYSAPRQWGAWRRAERTQWNVRAAFGAGQCLNLRSAPGHPDQPPIESARIVLANDPYAPEELIVRTGNQTVRVRPLAKMSIARPVGAKQRRARVTFGPAEVESVETAERGYGLYEYARLIDR